MAISPIKIEAYVRGLQYYEEKIRNRDIIPLADFAKRLNQSETFVQQRHSAGALYARSFDPAIIDEICKASPTVTPTIPLLLDFKRTGNLLFYPSWQCRVPEANNQLELPIVGKTPIIRPEIQMARTAHALFAQELKESDDKANTDVFVVNDAKLEGFFEQTGGLSDRTLSDYIVQLDQKKPQRPVTIKQLTLAWWYYENPYGNFT